MLDAHKRQLSLSLSLSSQSDPQFYLNNMNSMTNTF